MYELINNWIEANKAYSFEGNRGTRTLTKLVKDLDSNYTSIEVFLQDNPGAIEAIIGFIQDQNAAEWKENLACYAEEEDYSEE